MTSQMTALDVDGLKTVQPLELRRQGDRLFKNGQAVQAIACYQQALILKPDYAEVYNNLGLAFKQQNCLDEAVACYRKALEANPQYAVACNNLANALREQGRLAEAKIYYQKALGFKADFVEALNNLGNVLAEQGHLDEAVSLFEQALHIRPAYAEAYNNLGNALQEKREFSVAVHCYRQALKHHPRYYKALNNLGNVFQKQGQLHKALICYQRALEIKPGWGEAWNNTGNALVECGDIPEAMAAYTKAIGSNPGDAAAHSNLLLAMHYRTGLDPAVHYAAAENRRWKQPATFPQPQIIKRSAHRQKRLKIGYLSPDFRKHSVSFFFLPLLKNHNRQMFDIFCYSAVKREDEITRRIQAHADHWRCVVGLPDRLAAERIRSDGIDILVDLSGHTAGNRLPVFGCKPAPVQVTWLGYPGTTGLAAIDYRLTDDIADPPGEADKYHSERLIRLPLGFLCYEAPDDAPAVGGLPALRNGFITFGSFNNLPKINGEVIELWSDLLRQVPGSRLLLKSRQFADAHVRQRFLEMFGGCGIAAGRITLLPRVASTAGHLGLYHQVDIALDPFPYNGTTTTCESLWMGVPVITLRGVRHAGRVGVSLLTRLGLTQLVAEDRDAYIDIGIKLAQDIAALANLRSSLRPCMQASCLCDGSAFARSIEHAFFFTWENWCQKNGQQ